MNIQQLKFFTTVARLQNMSRAAKLLHVSQSSLSKQIAALEAELGVFLFDRNGKRITLNKAGMRFFESGNMILQELKAAEDDLRLFDTGTDLKIRIGICGMPESFTDCIADFSSKYPAASFVLNNRIEIDGHLNINDFDAVICPEELKYEKLSGYHLYDEKYFFAVHAKNIDGTEKVFSPSMLLKQPVIFMRDDAFSPEFPFSICSALAFPVESVFFTDTRTTHQKLISNGTAAGFVPVSEANIYHSDKNIRLLHIMDKRFTRPMKICFLREKHLSALGMEFRCHVTEYYHLGANADGSH